MKVIIVGANGFMGKLCVEEFLKNGHEVVAKIDKAGDGVLNSVYDYSGKADMIVDFSFHTSAKDICDYAVKNGIPAVIATTGHTEEEKDIIRHAAESIPVFYSGNMSMGVALLLDFAKRAAETFPDADVEILEIHHNRKADAPSGTALMIADSVSEVRKGANIVCGRSGAAKRDKNDVSIASLRLANVTGIHEVYVSTPSETITIKHEAHDRRLFAQGAVKAAEYLLGKPCGIYDIKSMKI